ncbi:MAG: hypothetical protein U0744_07890 [Gemmataceae bacterium]
MRFAFMLFAAMLFSIGCNQQAKVVNLEEHAARVEKDRARIEAEISETKIYLPAWYRSRTKARIVAEGTASAFAKADNPIDRGAWLLGLIVYSVFTLSVIIWAICTREHIRDDFRGEEFGNVVLGFLFYWAIGIVGCMLIALALAGIAFGLISVILPMVSTYDSVPFSFVISMTHLLVFCGIISTLLTWLTCTLRGIRPFPQESETLPPAMRTRNRMAFAVKQALRTLLIAILSGIGSSLGGWAGGLIVLVIASVAGAFFGGENSGGQEVSTAEQ